TDRSLDRLDWESVGATVLKRRAGGTRGWLKVQDGCDRKCAFCATRLARGPSRSRDPEVVIREAHALARHHPELVITGVHIGHYGRDLDDGLTLATLVERLITQVPRVRFRLGSIEATEVDEGLLELLAGSGGRVAPHLHMPLQSGADPVLRAMRRWHTREMYRARTLEIADRVQPLGLGADVISGFPGETEADHEASRRLIEELPFTYLHVFPYSPRDNTAAAEMPNPVQPRIARDRAAELRHLGEAKGAAYAGSRGGQRVEVVLEGDKGSALTEDYLRVRVEGAVGDRAQLQQGVLDESGSYVRIDLTPADGLN
ncbi:MAG: radical SAM protein, partial [Gemmatimonadetes bacterium]|nr:radical SAM protein [Gemmatimonadota bacterium]